MQSTPTPGSTPTGFNTPGFNPFFSGFNPWTAFGGFNPFFNANAFNTTGFGNNGFGGFPFAATPWNTGFNGFGGFNPWSNPTNWNGFNGWNGFGNTFGGFNGTPFFNTWNTPFAFNPFFGGTGFGGFPFAGFFPFWNTQSTDTTANGTNNGTHRPQGFAFPWGFGPFPFTGNTTQQAA